MARRLGLAWLTGLLALTGCGEGSQPSQNSSLGLDRRPANPDCLGSRDWPEKLSEHPCFESNPPQASSALVPYGVNAPLWSDGADKMRYLALPDAAVMRVARDGSIELPHGGVLVKEFADGATRLETRFLARDDDGEWLVATYVWNAEQSDATRASEGAEIPLDTESWQVPTEGQCFECHTEAAGVSLGLEHRQLNLTMEYPGSGRTADQLATLTGLGLLSGEHDEPPLVSPLDGDQQLSERARAYLHANCAHCHRPGGLGQGQIDLRASTPFRLTKTCDENPLQGDPIAEGGKLLAPGDPEASGLYVRMTSTDPTWRMPPVGSQVVDLRGSELIAEWIESLDSCP